MLQIWHPHGWVCRARFTRSMKRKGSGVPRNNKKQAYQRLHVMIDIEIRQVDSLQSVPTTIPSRSIRFRRSGSVEATQKLPHSLGFLILLPHRHSPSPTTLLLFLIVLLFLALLFSSSPRPPPLSLSLSSSSSVSGSLSLEIFDESLEP